MTLKEMETIQNEFKARVDELNLPKYAVFSLTGDMACLANALDSYNREKGCINENYFREQILIDITRLQASLVLLSGLGYISEEACEDLNSIANKMN